MKNQVTTIEQSRRLLELGVSIINAGQYEKGLKRGVDITIEKLQEFANEKQKNHERN